MILTSKQIVNAIINGVAIALGIIGSFAPFVFLMGMYMDSNSIGEWYTLESSFADTVEVINQVDELQEMYFTYKMPLDSIKTHYYSHRHPLMVSFNIESCGKYKWVFCLVYPIDEDKTRIILNGVGYDNGYYNYINTDIVSFSDSKRIRRAFQKQVLDKWHLKWKNDTFLLRLGPALFWHFKYMYTKNNSFRKIDVDEYNSSYTLLFDINYNTMS